MRLVKMTSCLKWCALTGTALTALTARTASAANSYTILDLGTLGGSTSLAGGHGSVNASGQVAGQAQTTEDAATRAFRTAANSAITPSSDLGTLGGISTAYAINDTGQVVGYSEGSANNGFRTAPNAPITPADDLGTLGGRSTFAYAVNTLDRQSAIPL